MAARTKFAYEVGPDGQHRPYLWLEISGANHTREYVRGLLDSAADVSLLPAQYAKLLGYEDRDLEALTVASPSGEIRVRRARDPLYARVPGERERDVPLRPLFADRLGEGRWGRDFMRYYPVTFTERDRQFSLFSD